MRPRTSNQGAASTGAMLAHPGAAAESQALAGERFNDNSRLRTPAYNGAFARRRP